MKFIKTFVFLLFVCSVTSLSAQKMNPSETAIRGIMAKQEAAWNSGDLEGFMKGYWRSDSLKFIGSRGLTYGWDQTLRVYQKGYPDQAAMGKLTFTLYTVDQLSRKSAFVVGKWHLDRAAGELSGHFTLLWKKIKGEWVIVADHSS